MKKRHINHPPTDALIYLVVRGRLRRHIPIGLGRNALTDIRIAVVLQRWNARQVYVITNVRSGRGKSQTFLPVSAFCCLISKKP